MSERRRLAAKRPAGSSFFRWAAAQIDQLHAATRAKSSRFDAAAVTGHLETFFDEQRCIDVAGLACRRTI